MITYPITLKSDPEQPGVLHRFDLIEGSTEGDGFELISTWLKLPESKKATRACTICGVSVELPDGSLEAHLKRYQAEHGGEDKIVRILYHHTGPRPSTPPGVSVVTDKTKVVSIKDAIRMQENSQQGS